MLNILSTTDKLSYEGTRKKENSSLSIQQAKKITVTGIVKDTHGEPLIGVNVLVKGSRTGTITDMDGHFFIK